MHKRHCSTVGSGTILKSLFFRARVLCLLLVPMVTGVMAQPKQMFKFNEGDRVALVGDTLIEREQSYSATWAGAPTRRRGIPERALTLTSRDGVWSF
jgi:hypothetical protein